VIITYDEVPIENWYISGEQSREQRDFGIPSICMQHKEIWKMTTDTKRSTEIQRLSAGDLKWRLELYQK